MAEELKSEKLDVEENDPNSTAITPESKKKKKKKKRKVWCEKKENKFA